MRTALAKASPAPNAGPRLLQAWRRLGVRHIAAALAIGMLLLLLNAQYHVATYRDAWGSALKLPFAFLTGTIFMLAVTAADEFVERGTAPLSTYGVAVAVAAISTSVINWHLGRLLGLPGHFGVDTPAPIRMTEMLFTSISHMLQAGFGVAVYVHWRARQAALQELHLSELRQAREARRLHETRLLALQARVDPEFLFAALSRVGDLQRTERRKADDLLEEVIGLLRAVMPGSETGVSTVEREFALAESYMRIANEGTGSRLDVAIGPGADEACLAPMLLLPLLKVALARETGAPPSLQLGAAIAPGELHVTLRATRTGAACASATALTELTALRERIEQLHRRSARLIIEQGSDWTATLQLPLEHADRADR